MAVQETRVLPPQFIQDLATDFGKQMGTGGYQSAAANSVRGLWAGGYASSPRHS